MTETPEPADREFATELLDRILFVVIQDNPDKVDGWVAGESGCWGYLAGKAITAWRVHLGRSLPDQERRWVWHRLWTYLEQVKARGTSS